jgi:hypothetical protein
MVREKRSARGSDEPQPQEEMTVIVLKFKGGSHSVHKAFDAVSQALSLLGPGGQSNNQNVVQRQPRQLPSAEGKVIDGEAQHLAEEFAADDSGEETPGSSNDFNDELRESEVLTICCDAGIINKNIYNIMHAAFSKRNAAAHPNAVIIDSVQADAFISEPITNVVQQIVRLQRQVTECHKCGTNGKRINSS